MVSRPHPKFSAIVALILLIGVSIIGYAWFTSGYGEISPVAYEYSKALYGACLNRNETHLNRVDAMLDEVDENELPERERRWLEKIIGRARKGHWQNAANDARQMMEDQVSLVE